MKLIDRDKLPLTYKQGIYIGHGIYDGEGYYVDGNEVANAPEVEAIPIDWIIKFFKKQKHGNYKDFIDFMIKYWKSGHEL